MSTIAGVTIHKKVCRACLTYDEGVRYCKMKKRKRFFTRLANLPIDSSTKNWLCIQCAHKISSILAFHDKVVQVNQELNRVLAKVKSGSKVALQHIEECRKLVPMNKLSPSRTSIMDSVSQISPVQTARPMNRNIFIEHVYFDEANTLKNIHYTGDTLTDTYVKTETVDMDNFEDTLNYLKSFDDNVGYGADVTRDLDSDSNLDRSIVDLNIDGLKIEDDCDPISLPTPAKRSKLQSKRKKTHSSHTDSMPDDDTDDVAAGITGVDKVYVINLSLEQQRADHNQLAFDKNYLNAVYKCTICYKGFSYEETYDGHMETHNESYGEYKSCVCHKYIKSRGSYQSHMLNHSKRYKCAECDFTRMWRTLVIEHYAVTHDANTAVLTCDLCGKHFWKKTQLRHHLRYTHRENDRFECVHCGKKFKTSESHRRHIVRQHLGDRPEGEKRFICPICGARFHNSTFLRRHQVKHSTNRDFYCADCGIYFKSEMILKAHLRTSSKHFDPGKLIQCSQCSFRAMGDREMTRHIEARHLGITNFQCSQCPRAFYASNALRRHCRETHEGFKRPKMHVCDVCGKTFAVKNTLICHRNTHTGEKPYACKECDSRFAGSGALYTHVKLVHRKMKRDVRGRFKPIQQAGNTTINV